LENHLVGLNFEFSIGMAALWRGFTSSGTATLREKSERMEADSAVWNFDTNVGIWSWASKKLRTTLIEWAWSLQIM
jgi:hypothetical protein